MYQQFHLPSASRYLDTRVTTASQPELQLMLLDGALRFGRRAQELWKVESERNECDRLLGRVLPIVEELLRGVTGRGIETARRLEEEYAFAYRQVAASRLQRDAAALESALAVLEFHRETWRLACEKLKTAGGAAPPPAPSAAFQQNLGGAPAERFSLEA